tara:strand:+ start:3284 stop:3766 length:483 start_codon:yes stop_codon:yes gene_type:complete
MSNTDRSDIFLILLDRRRYTAGQIDRKLTQDYSKRTSIDKELKLMKKDGMVCSKKIKGVTSWFLSDDPEYDKLKLNDVAKLIKNSPRKITNLTINNERKKFKEKYGSSDITQIYENGDYAQMKLGAKKYTPEDFKGFKKKTLSKLAKAGELIENIADHSQ